MKALFPFLITSLMLSVSAGYAVAADPFLVKKPSTVASNPVPAAPNNGIPVMPNTGTPPGVWTPPANVITPSNGGGMYPGNVSSHTPNLYGNNGIPGSAYLNPATPAKAGPEVVEAEVDVEWKGTINGQHIYASRDGNYVMTESIKKKTYKRNPKVSFVPKSQIATPEVPGVVPPNGGMITNGNPNGLPSMVGGPKTN